MACANCGTENPAGAKFCMKCGTHLNAAPLAYTPVAASGFGAAAMPAPEPQVRREDNVFVVPVAGSTLPAFCVKCGQPATSWIKKTYYWHNPLLFLLIILGLLIYAIVAMIVRKKAVLAVPLCAGHNSARKRNLWIGAILLIAWLPVSVALFANDYNGLGVVAIFGLIIASIVFFGLGVPLKPTLIDETCGKFKGACPAFLDQIAR